MKHTLEKIEKLYSTSLKEHGVTSKSVGWRDEASQRLRFEKLATVIENKEGSVTVNDLGCGYGAMYNFLSKDYMVESYNGFDISDEMLDKAKHFIAHNDNVNLYKNDKLDTLAEYSFISGIFNVKFEEDEQSWKDFIIQMLENINKFSKKGFSFNLLTSYVDYKEPHLYYGDPLFFFDYCKKNFSKKVSLIHDYNLWEWTITVTKESR